MQPISPEFDKIKGVIDVLDDYDCLKYKPVISSNLSINNIAFKIILDSDFDIKYLVIYLFYLILLTLETHRLEFFLMN